MINYMEDVAKVMGLELGEPFNYTEDERYWFFLSEDGLKRGGVEDGAYDTNVLCVDLVALLTGQEEIIRKMTKPQNNQEYWYVNEKGRVGSNTWCGNTTDNNLYKIGNIYRNRQEAEANADKWLQFYASDQVLKV